jgi:20S proteasome subunit beta 1
MQMNFDYKHLVGAMIVAGWDETEGGQVYGCPIGGTISREQWTTDGSGSTFLWGYLESEYREGMSSQEAEDLVSSALALAMSRDGSSGGVIRLVNINKDGATRKWITPDEHPKFWDELAEPVGMTI